MGFLVLLLQILKWIGIVLACVLGLVILIVLLLLFVPFRYRIEGEKYEETRAKARVTWLLRFARYDACYEGGKSFHQKLRVLFFKIMDSSSEVGEESDTLTDEEAEELSDDLEDLAAENGQEPKNPEVTEKPEDAGKTEETGKPENAGKTEEPGKSEETEKPGNTKDPQSAETGDPAQKEDEKERKTIGEIFQDINDKILEFLEKPEKTVSKLIKKKDAIVKVAENEQNRATVALAKKILIKLLKAILPKSGKGKIRFGTGDPGSTGELLAAAAVMYIPLKGRMKVVPDFEEKVFEGEGVIKGRIFLGTIILLAARFWFDRNFKASRHNFEVLKKKLKK